MVFRTHGAALATFDVISASKSQNGWYVSLSLFDWQLEVDLIVFCLYF